jgi:hypothetical protein
LNYVIFGEIGIKKKILLHFFQFPLHVILVRDDFFHRKVVQEGWAKGKTNNPSLPKARKFQPFKMKCGSALHLVH